MSDSYPSNQAKRLRELLAGEQLVQAPGAADPLTARLVEQAGFPAIYMTGFGATASRIGAPDVGLLTQWKNKIGMGSQPPRMPIIDACHGLATEAD